MLASAQSDNKEVLVEKNKEQELLKSVADILDDALAVYDELNKGEGTFSNIENADDMKGQAKGIVGEGSGAAMAKEDEEKPEIMADEDKDQGQDQDEDEDKEKMMSAFKSLVAKMEKSGIDVAKIAKSAPAALDKSEALKKSVDERFEALSKAVKDVAETVKKIASQPASRKGVSGYAPLQKSEAGTETLKKSDVLNKLLDLRKSGDARVDSMLINRVETGRISNQDAETLRALNIVK